MLNNSGRLAMNGSAVDRIISTAARFIDATFGENMRATLGMSTKWTTLNFANWPY